MLESTLTVHFLDTNNELHQEKHCRTLGVAFETPKT